MHVKGRRIGSPRRKGGAGRLVLMVCPRARLLQSWRPPRWSFGCCVLADAMMASAADAEGCSWRSIHVSSQRALVHVPRV